MKSKICTNIEQSKKLIELGIDVNTADMCYPYFGDGLYGIIARVGKPMEYSSKSDIPAWSLSALLNILPSATLDTSDGHHCRIRCCEKFTGWHNNAVNAVFEMIVKLKTLKEES